MIRNTLFASLIVLGATGAAQAAEPGPRLVNVNGSLEVIRAPASGTVVGGAFATISGGGDNLVYQAAPGGRNEAVTGLIGRVENVNGAVQVVYAPAAPAVPAAYFAGR